MDTDELENILSVGGERRHIEHKSPLPWDDLKIKVTKAALALANIQDGGFIIIGGRERDDGSLERQGLSSQEQRTWDRDEISEYIHTFADPKVEMEMDFVDDTEGNTFFVIEVSEFDRIPVITKKDHPDIPRGRIFHRNRKKIESAPVATHQDLREILDLATDKGVRKWVTRTRRVGIEPEDMATDPYEEELQDFP